MESRFLAGASALVLFVLVQYGICEAADLIYSPNAGLISAYQTGEWSESTQDVMVCCHDTNGNGRWARSWGRPANETLTGLAADASGDALVCGHYGMVQYEEYAPIPSFILKFNSSGDLLWAKDIGWSDFSIMLEDVTADSANNIYATGSAWKYDSVAQPGGWHGIYGFVFTIKLTPNGDVVWAKRWNSVDKAQPIGMALVSNGYEVAVAAYFDNNASGEEEVAMLWYDVDDGKLEKLSSLGLEGKWIRPVEMCYSQTGDTYVLCWNSGDTDVILLKYSSGRTLHFTQGWGSNDLNNGLEMDVYGNCVYIVGSQQVGSLPPDNTGWEAPVYRGLSVIYSRDVVVDQAHIVDDTVSGDIYFDGVTAVNNDLVFFSGKGTVVDTDLAFQEAKGIGWQINGRAGSPQTEEDINCGANSFAIENATYRIIDGGEYMDYIDSTKQFISQVDWVSEGGIPDTQLEADVTSGPAPLTVNFNASGTTVASGSISNYSWDFNLDDGLDYATDTGLNATTQFTFTEPGTYTVVVNATSDDGSQLPATIQITVTP